MKIPLFSKEYKPRVVLGRDKNLTQDQILLLDSIDILEQKADRANTLSAWSLNFSILLFVLMLVLQGPAIGKILQDWFSTSRPSHIALKE